MQKYKLCFVVTNNYSVEVEADSKESAWGLYMSGKADSASQAYIDGKSYVESVEEI